MPTKLSILAHKKYFRMIFMALGIIISLICFEEVVDDVFNDPAEGDLEAKLFDHSIAQWVNGVRTPILNQVMTDFTALGSVSVVATLLLILVSILATFRDWRGISYLCLVGIGAGLLPTLLKTYFNRERPTELGHLVQVLDLSFPSGHSFGAASIYIALAYYSAQYARSWTQELFFYGLGVILILIVGCSRIYLGVHYPTDVLAGLAGGIAWGLGVSAGYELHRQRRFSQSIHKARS